VHYDTINLSIHDALPICAQPEPNANETALEQSVLAALNVPLPTPRPKHQPESTVDVAEAMTEANSDLPMPVAYVTPTRRPDRPRSEEHTSELQSRENLVC